MFEISVWSRDRIHFRFDDLSLEQERSKSSASSRTGREFVDAHTRRAIMPGHFSLARLPVRKRLSLCHSALHQPSTGSAPGRFREDSSVNEAGCSQEGGRAWTSLFVDTNVFLRFLTNDDPAKAKRAETLFRDALRGKIKLVTSLLVIAEIIWTLESFHKLEKPDIAAEVEKILNTHPGQANNKPLLRRSHFSTIRLPARLPCRSRPIFTVNPP